MRNMLREQRGISLIELLVGIVVFVILFLLIDSVFISAHRSSRKAELTAEVDQNARIAIERLTREIRESAASEIVIALGSDQVIFRSARLPTDLSVFCIDVNSGPLYNSDCQNLTGDNTFAPVWQQSIGYYVDDSSTPECQVGAGKSGKCIRRVSSSALSFPLTGGQVVATFIETFTVSKSCVTDFPGCTIAPVTFLVTIKASGQEVVQGSPVPPQEILLNGTTLIRN